MATKRVLVTCRQMQESLPNLAEAIKELGWELVCPDLQGRQQFDSEDMAQLLSDVDGAIVGDDFISTESVSRASKLSAICKWGIGVDGIDIKGLTELGIDVSRTPNMFGEEVADVALAYTIALARDLFVIDREVRAGSWYKPVGHSLRGMRATVVGYGDIGQALEERLTLLGVGVSVVEPDARSATRAEAKGLKVGSLHEVCVGSNFLHITCPLTRETRGMVDTATMSRLAFPSYVVNVARGPIVNERDLVDALTNGIVTGAALDVFEEEPPHANNPLLQHRQVLLGSHNSSNTHAATLRASSEALVVLSQILDKRS